MVLFRPVREFLDEAMAEVKEISSLEEVRPSYAKGKLSTEYQGFDKRTGWDTWLALDEDPEYSSPQCFGYTNGPL